MIGRAESLIESPSAFDAHESHGAARYVRSLRLGKETGEVADGRALSLDEEAIAEAEALDGYYLIVTSELGWSDERILDAYRELWRIEESLGITKSEIRTRPACVWKEAHIEAHFLICYVALTILRLLQDATGLPAACIRDEMAAMSATNFEGNWWVFDHRTDDSDLLVDTLGLEEFKLKCLTTKGGKAGPRQGTQGETTTQKVIK